MKFLHLYIINVYLLYKNNKRDKRVYLLNFDILTTDDIKNKKTKYSFFVSIRFIIGILISPLFLLLIGISFFIATLIRFFLFFININK